ncbi:hypothetical protein N0V86_006249 [Didymella sp. IMI 355093]|nr:hypothetical protein N0V86_006249 [Didymella sp. IMI 355093]
MSSTKVPRVVPAQLSFLAVYNPALGDSDETFHKQIVFYYAKAARARAKLGNASTQQDEALREEENEKLRQVGLAQGMVGFARSFSNGESVDSIDTDKSRIVLHELEHGWWILASVDLTQLPAANTSKDANNAPAVEYSSREVSPPALLIQQLIRAHGVFTLHHGWPLEQLFKKHGRAKFCNILNTYWSRFCSSWDVLLHGSPAVDMFNGLKLAAGGELGMGVGEEEWGSSERDVLEDFARRTEGLVDVLVSRFGEASPAQDKRRNADARPRDDAPAEPWMGSSGNVAATDGVVFSGVGGLSRASLRDVAHWTESIYHYGDHAYGIRDNPTADRRRRRRRDPNASKKKPEPPAKEDKAQPDDSGTGEAPRIPPPIVKAVESSLDNASRAVDASEGRTEPAKQESGTTLASLGDTETWVKYMTLGYGTAWGNRKQPESTEPPPLPVTDTRREQSPEAMRYIEPAPDIDLVEEKRKAQVRAENDGYFLIGLKGDMVEAGMDDEDDEANWNARIPLRTVYVQAVNKTSSVSESDETPSEETHAPSWNAGVKLEKNRLRPVVYVHRPFIYTFLFAHRTPSLTLATFYRSLHAFFAPLHRSLDRNTAPSRVAQRLAAARTHQTTTPTTSAQGPNPMPIYDLVWDPRTLTLHSSLPNIPDPGTLIAEGLSSKDGVEGGWSRIDALNVHSLIVATVTSTRRGMSEIERSCKTSRGWWVVWMRLPPSQPSPQSPSETENEHEQQEHSADGGTERSVAFNTDELRQAFLVRRARDADPTHPKTSGRSIASGMWSGMGMGGSTQQRMGGKAAGWGPKGLAEGIGIDARRYVDELLSLNR